MNTLTAKLHSNTRRLCHQLRKLSKGSHSLGIDVGQVNTKLVCAEQDSAGAITYQAVSIPTTLAPPTVDQPPSEAEVGVDEDGAVDNEVDEGTAESSTDPVDKREMFTWSTRGIRTLMDRVSQVVGGNSRSHSPEVGVTLSMSACDYRTLYVPKNARVSTVGVEQSIAAAVGDNRPRCVALIPGHETPTEARQTKLRCFSLAEDLAWSVAQQLDGVGLTPNAINGLPWCIANALEMVAPADEDHPIQIGIDWSYGSPTLVSVKRGTLDYVRCMSTGSLQDLLSQSHCYLSMSPFEAGRWLAYCTQLPDTQQADAAANECRAWAREVCTKLAAEIEIAVEFIKWRNQGVKLDSIWLMGGATRIAGLTELLQSMLTCELKLWDLGDESGDLPADYAMAASLAWMGLRHA